jgi:hypothetical protein
MYNTGTIKVSLNHTLPISLHYSTHKAYKSHVKSSQADFLYSSVLLQLTAILRPLNPRLRNSPHLYRRVTHTDLQKTHHVIAIQPVHLRSGWTYTKHISRGRYLLLCDVTADTKKTQLPLLLRARISGVA